MTESHSILSYRQCRCSRIWPGRKAESYRVDGILQHPVECFGAKSRPTSSPVLRSRGTHAAKGCELYGSPFPQPHGDRHVMVLAGNILTVMIQTSYYCRQTYRGPQFRRCVDLHARTSRSPRHAHTPNNVVHGQRGNYPSAPPRSPSPSPSVLPRVGCTLCC